MADKIFADGLIFKAPHEKAPDFVKGTISVGVEKFIEFLKKHGESGWVNLDVKESKKGTLYVELNTWKKE